MTEKANKMSEEFIKKLKYKDFLVIDLNKLRIRDKLSLKKEKIKK